MSERLATLRAALWRAIALTLVERPRWEHQTIIAVAKHVDETLTVSAQLFGDSPRAAKENAS
jgi:hypothetical protein